MAAMTSLRVGSAAKLAGELAAAALGLVTGVITARVLGPGGKGILSTLNYLATIVASVAALGLGEAAVTAAARGTRTLEQAVRASSGVLLISSTVGIGAFVAIAASQYYAGWGTLTVAIAANAVTVPLIVVTTVFTLVADARSQFVLTAAARLGMAVAMTGATIAFVIVVEKDLSGASVALAAGWAVGAMLTLVAVRSAGVRVWPTIDAAYVRAVLPLGIAVQAAQVMTVLMARVDLVLVNGIDGILPAGRYSVALTIGVLVTYGPFVIATAAYSRLAAVEEAELRTFVSRLSRMTVIIGVASAVPLAASLGWLVPFAFGEDFRGAVAPAAILCAGGVVWSVQWVLCRARSARGDGGLLLRSFGASVVGTVVLDVALIPMWGIVGAAVASSLASAIGLAVALASYRRRDGIGAVELLLPRRPDVAELRFLITSATAGLLRRDGDRGAEAS
jgi:stage V sporulation protein B